MIIKITSKTYGTHDLIIDDEDYPKIKDLYLGILKQHYNKKKYFLGRFHNKEDAAKAYNEAARKLHGEFAILNTVIL